MLRSILQLLRFLILPSVGSAANFDCCMIVLLVSIKLLLATIGGYDIIWFVLRRNRLPNTSCHPIVVVVILVTCSVSVRTICRTIVFILLEDNLVIRFVCWYFLLQACHLAGDGLIPSVNYAGYVLAILLLLLVLSLIGCFLMEKGIWLTHCRVLNVVRADSHSFLLVRVIRNINFPIRSHPWITHTILCRPVNGILIAVVRLMRNLIIRNWLVTTSHIVIKATALPRREERHAIWLIVVTCCCHACSMSMVVDLFSSDLLRLNVMVITSTVLR